ncbi:hypothetical protein FisN_6Hh105 [Fistulifera solaris]|uniref:Uncharacterized protein n=1 Tax=Fistulifera solaris TaxID=1519565 RepID=A0A1Z5KI06_FISSO|nr:hypothetical protein FisN_6Hh105 [Fistulifera solaris]|eukprot:GAX25857.1 hypothetical protein FisN_6Hh105 [Fistulifera solaris]
MLLLDIRPNDFHKCTNVEEEFTAIERKTFDLKAFCGPSEVGYASRIREINAAHRKLKQLFEEGTINSFSQYLCQDVSDEEGMPEATQESGNDVLAEINNIELRFQ